MLTLGIVTATTDRLRAASCIDSWGRDPFLHITIGRYGVVPTFRQGVDDALDQWPQVDLIACFHDDLEIHDPHWYDRVCRYFAENPGMGLAGFGGAVGLGDDDLYQTPYRPEQLARKGFRSNLIDAEAHGMRSLVPERVACLDGFSLVGRRAFWEGMVGPHDVYYTQRPRTIYDTRSPMELRPWTILQNLGMIHHFYDSAMGCLAARYGWETWYLPIACRHYGGRTAVGDPQYQRWAVEQRPDGGDRAFWEEAHRAGYDAFRDVLPLRV